jgi:hypothetical protein
MGQSTTKPALGLWSDARTFDRLHRLLPVLLCHRSLSAIKDLAGGLWWLMAGHRCHLHKFLHGLQREVIDLQPY